MSYYIIFPSGDKTRIRVKEIEYSHEVHDYALASRRDFDDVGDAVEYAKQLAKEHGKIYDGDDEGYLD